MAGSSGGALRELLALFEIGVEDEELEKASKKLEGFVGRVRKVGEVVAEVFAVNLLREFFGEQIEAAERLTVLSERLGVATDQLQKFQYAASLAGVDSEQAAHSLGFLNRAVGEALTGGKEQAQDFAKLHVALKDTSGAARPVGDILGDVADSIAKLPDPQTKAAMAMKLFGREGQVLLPVLSKGRKGLEEIGKEFDELGGGMSKEYVEAATHAAEQTKKLNLAWTSLKARITGAALPAIERVIGGMRNAIHGVIDFADHTKLLEHGMTILATIASAKLILSLIKMAKVFGLLKPSILGTVRSLASFGLPLLLVGLLVLAFEDLWTAIQGGDSVLKDVLVSMYGTEGAKEIIDELTVSFNDVKAVWTDLAPLGKEVFKGILDSAPAVIKIFLGLLEALKAIVSVMKVLTGWAGVAASRAGDLLGGGMSDEKIARLKAEGQHISMADEAVNNVQRAKHASALAALDQVTVENGRDLRDSIGIIGDLISGRKAPPQVPNAVEGQPGMFRLPELTITGGKGGEAPSVNQHNEINVTVQGGDNARQTGEAVGAGVASKLERTNYNAQLALVRK